MLHVALHLNMKYVACRLTNITFLPCFILSSTQTYAAQQAAVLAVCISVYVCIMRA